MLDNRKLRKIKSESVKERVYAELRLAIMTGMFAPGKTITIRALAEQMEVGVMPVRESVQRLVAEGALIILQSRSVAVPYLTCSEFEDIYELRIRLEGMAVENAANNMTDEVITKLLDYQEKGEFFSQQNDPVRSLEYNIKLHFTIYEQAQSPYLTKFIEALWLKMGPLMVIPMRLPIEAREKYLSKFEGESGYHSALINALKENNTAVSSNILNSIISSAADWYRENYAFSDK